MPGPYDDRATMARLAAARDGHRDALGLLYDQFGIMVFNVAMRLVQDADAAADIVQDVFWSLPRALRTFEARGPFDAWLRRIALRRALMHLRQQARRSADHTDHEVQIPTRVVDPVDSIEIHDAMRRLEPHLREVFVLKVIEGYRHEEIAELLAISEANSKIRLYRARKALQSWLTGDRHDSPS